jgi:hypothetical protein
MARFKSGYFFPHPEQSKIFKIFFLLNTCPSKTIDEHDPFTARRDVVEFFKSAGFWPVHDCTRTHNPRIKGKKSFMP